MNFLGLFYLLLAHYFSGKGILRLFKLQLKPVEDFCFSNLLGVPLLSLVPCFIQLAGVPITVGSVSSGIAIFTLLCAIPLLFHMKRPVLGTFSWPALSESPFLFVVVYLVIVSIWRCFYLPPFARDMLTGPELIAEFTVREKTMINSVFTTDLQLGSGDASNIFKSPYITGLQIIYKLLVQQTGQLWMSVLYVPFILWLYLLIRDRIHPFITGLLMFLFMISPDLYAYSYIMLYDYSNVIFFFIGFYYLVRYLDNKKINYLAWASFSFGISTFIRVETIILVMMFMPVLLFHFYKSKTQAKSIVNSLAIFVGAPAAFYILCQNVFINHFIPFKFDAFEMINHNIFDLFPLFERLHDILSKLIFSAMGEGSYGYYIYFFTGIVGLDLILVRKFNREALLSLYGILVVYFGLAVIGYLFHNTTIENTTKRGIFKAMPIMLIYMSNSGILRRLAEYIKKWELNLQVSKPVTQPAQTRATPKPAPVSKPAPKPVRKK